MGINIYNILNWVKYYCNRNFNLITEKEICVMKIGRLIIQIIVSAIAIAIAAFFTPGMSIQGGIWTLIVAAIVIGVLDWLISRFTSISASPFGRGFIGFIVAAIVLYVTGLIVDGFNVSFIGAIIGALVLGIVDAIIPGDQVLDNK